MAEKTFKCGQCNSETVFESASALASHINKALGKHPNPWFDKACYHNDKCVQKFYPDKKSLNDHLMSPAHKFKPCKIPGCDDVITNGKNMGSHIGNVHSNGEKKFKCTKCDKSFDSKESLKVHRKQCKPPKDKSCEK